MKNLLISILLILISNFITMGQIHNETVTDIDGNVYKTVKIGDQIWMAEFLKTTKYKDGSEIPIVKDKNEWAKLTSGAYPHFSDKPKKLIPYGRLYNWFAVNDERGLCPNGWHVPSREEWEELDSVLRTSTKYNEQKGWWSYEVHGSSYLPPDYRNKKGLFLNSESEIRFSYGGWWTSSDINQEEAWHATVGFSSYNMMMKKNHKNAGFCVLCIKDN